jgi:hypothetical protein
MSWELLKYTVKPVAFVQMAESPGLFRAELGNKHHRRWGHLSLAQSRSIGYSVLREFRGSFACAPFLLRFSLDDDKESFYGSD